MAQYILLLHLTPAGRESIVADPQTLTRAANDTESEGVNALGLYAVLGRYDFVCILDAPDNEAAATYSLELGVRGGGRRRDAAGGADRAARRRAPAPGR